MARASSLASPWPGCTLRTVPSVHEVCYFLTCIVVGAPGHNRGGSGGDATPRKDTTGDRR